MNISRAVLAGIMTWVLTFGSFAVMSFIPIIKDSELCQSLIVYLLLVPIVILGVRYYYNKGERTNGLIVGLIMVAIGLILDTLITIPFVMVPLGGSYASFFSRIFLWILVFEYVLVAFLYWKLKISISSNFNEERFSLNATLCG